MKGKHTQTVKFLVYTHELPQIVFYRLNTQAIKEFTIPYKIYYCSAYYKSIAVVLINTANRMLFIKDKRPQ